MKRTIRHLLAFTALAAIAALADVAVKQSELNEIPGNVRIATNMVEVVDDINQRIAQGGGSSAEIYAAALAATNYTDSAISATNPAFAEAVKATQLSGASESDLAEIAEYGSYGTIGAALLALIAGVAALKRGKLDAVDVRYIINPVAVRKTLPDGAVVYDATGTEVSDWHIDKNNNSWVLSSAADGQEEARMYWNADGSPSYFSTPGSGWSIVVGSTTYSESTSPILPTLVEVCTLTDRAVNCLSVSSSTSINFKLPASPDAEGATPKHVRDFILDIDNSENTSQSLTVNFDYLGTDFALTCDSSTSVAALCSIAGNTRVRLHFKETGLTVLNNLPVFFMERVTLGSFVTNT